MSYSLFKKLCDSKGVRPSDVSKATGIGSSTLTSWKQGKYEPKADKLQLIADYFGVSVEYLLTGEMKSHFWDDETATIAQEIFEDSEMRLLFDAAKGSRPEDIKMARDMLLALKRRSGNA